MVEMTVNSLALHLFFPSSNVMSKNTTAHFHVSFVKLMWMLRVFYS